jgi:hypothetical protein
MNRNLGAGLKSIGVGHVKFTTQHGDAIWFHKFQWPDSYQIGTRGVRAGASDAPAKA